ncbi:MAG: DsbA family protein [Candidatus Saccharibacteria bacterium]
MDKRFMGIIAAIILIFGGVIILSNHKNNGSIGQPSNHTTGKNAKSVALIEYGDYECPACESYYPVVKQVVAQYQNDISFQFRNLPLTQIHPNAFAGARAAEAASLQSKFWEMHDALYDNQNTWSTSSDPTTFFWQYAQQLGLNVTKFKTDYASSQVNGTINADIDAFNKTGAATQTPTFFLDGKRIDTTATLASFQKVLDAEIAQKSTAK